VKILVTGGSGFIGSHVCELLVAAGGDVRVLDRVAPPSARLTEVDFRQGDVADPRAVAAAVDGVDAVCHQAAMVGLGVDFADVTSYVSNNDIGTAVLLEELWRRTFRGRLVLASSMVVYGEGLARCPVHGVDRPGPRRRERLDAGRFEPQCRVAGCRAELGWEEVDEDRPVDPRNVYAATKVHQEHLCRAWERESGGTVVALRYHNVYGPGMPRDTPYAGVAAIFRSSLAAGRPPQVFEDGGQTRDFVHVSDVARANVLALTAPDDVSGTYNVASGTPHTVREMADALADAFGPDSPRPIVTGGYRLGDVRHIVASPARAAARLGFVAETSFVEGMREFAMAPMGDSSTR
jgi:dTDP-L-rhamnose 4-epimerase